MSVLVDSNNQPLFWPNVFATMEFRNKSPKTLSSVLRALGMFELWLATATTSCSNALSTNSALDIHEAEDLANFLKLTRPAQDQAVIKSSRPQRTITRLENARASKTRLIEKSRYAGGGDAANRIRWVAKYLEFLRDISIGHCHNYRAQKLMEKKATASINKLKKLAPRVNSSAGDESLVGIDTEIIDLVSGTLNPANRSSKNPFRKPFLQHRNFLIWCLFVETGARREELVKLKVDDIDYSTRLVSIRESKTLPRTVPISAKTAEVFHNFIVTQWAELPAGQTKHGFLITDENGRHLKNNTINSLFSRIRTIPNVPNFLTPHTLRRSWNERFSQKIDEKPEGTKPSLNEENQMRNRLMGWSDKSNMTTRYAKRHTRRKSDRIAEELANELINP